MKKERTEKQNEARAERIDRIKGVIPPLVFVLVIAAMAAVIALLPAKEEVVENIEVHRYEGGLDQVVLENGDLKFVMDPETTQFSLTNKSSGLVWYSNPLDVDDDPIALPSSKDSLRSTLLLKYSTDIGTNTTLDNYKYSIENQVYDIEPGSDMVKVNYSIGKVQKEYIVPQVVSEEEMDALKAEITSAKDAAEDTKVKNELDSALKMMRDYYVKYDINNLKPTDNKDELLEKYPILNEKPIYVLREETTDNVKGRFENAFAIAGYTEEEYRKEIEEYGIESVNDKPVFNISVIYRLVGEELIVEVPMDEMEYRSNYPIIELTVLPYFGAGGTAEEGYLLLPEGGGSIVNFNNGKTAQNLYYSNVYGWDMAQGRKELVHETRAYYGVFGIAKGDSSFICMLEDGAAYAAINADISGKQHSYNYVNASYTLLHRERVDVGSRTNTDMFMYEQSLPQESIRQRYRFVDSGNYVDMANSYHDYLGAKYGDAFSKNEDSSVPVSVEIIGAVDKVKQILGVPVSKPLPVTSYQEAQAILEDISSEGVNNLSVKLSGWVNGGVRQKILKRTKLVSGLGGKKNLKSLISYTNDNGIDLYLDGVTNYAYKSNILDGFFASADAASFANKKRVKLLPFDPVDYAPQNWMDSYYLLKPALVDRMIGNLSDAANTYGAAGVSFSDIGFQLSADYRPKELVTRQAALNAQVEKVNEIRTSGQKVMINSGNDYMIGQADFIVNMDLAGSEYTIIDKLVPFYQIALHGYVNYAGEPLNLTKNCEEEVLRSAEYGAGLYVTFMDAPITELQNTYYTQYFGSNYDSWKNTFFEIYERYESSLGHTFNQRIVDHQIPEEGIAVTQYEDGTRVYVNYQYVDYTTGDGVLIPARDYVVK